MSKATLEKWSGAAWALEDVKTTFTPPIRVLLGEAVDLARFTAAYWEPTVDGAKRTLRPGLSQAGPKLGANIWTEILELQEALQTAHTDYLPTVATAQEDVRARAEYVFSEIRAPRKPKPAHLVKPCLDDAATQPRTTLLHSA